jgi:hypothetical protein
MFAVFRLMGIAWTIIERQDQAGQQHGLSVARRWLSF